MYVKRILTTNTAFSKKKKKKKKINLLNLNDTFHTDVIRSKLIRNIAVTFKEVREELIMAMDDFIPMSGNGKW